MTYQAVTEQFIKEGYQRIERDDRLLDILPDATREKGVELWEKEEPDQLLLVHLRLPYDPKKTTIYAIPRPLFNNALLTNTPLALINWQLPISHLSRR